MFSKVLLVAAIVGISAAQYSQGNGGSGYGHDHGHAISSQNGVLRQSHGHEQNAPAIAHYSHQPGHPSHGGHHVVEYHAPAHYGFEYSVHDPHTGDIKSQHETREGDDVHGFYSLHEADGTVRRVDYTVDKHSGFNAVVHREGHATHAAPVHHEPAHHSY